MEFSTPSPSSCSQIWETETLYSADVVANCPVDLAPDLFVCGTYQLEESAESSSAGKRLGSFQLYRITKENDGCQLLQTVELPGVLDARFVCLEKIPFLAAALASGQITLFKLVDNQLKHAITVDSSHNNVIALTLDCSDEDSRILTSDTSGCVTLLNMSHGHVVANDRWKAHDFEVWAVAMCPHDGNLFFSGGDDSLLKLWDFRNHQQPQATVKRHTMGVTCITSFKKRNYHFLTGSYDEKIRLWDTRSLKNCLTECDTGGGVWRLKWDSNEENLLAACMHNGFHVFSENLIPKASYMKHKSLAYGADWIRSVGQLKMAATCSFYDRSLQVWSMQL